jgi:hypothetical protein
MLKLFILNIFTPVFLMGFVLLIFLVFCVVQWCVIYISVHCNVTVLFIVNVFTSINNLALNYTTRCSPYKLKLCSSQTAPAEPYLSLRTVVNEWLLFNANSAFFFSSPCQRQCELLPSLGVHRSSSVVH